MLNLFQHLPTIMRVPNMNEAFVYIMANTNNAVLYIGVTSNIEVRVLEHRFKIIKGFTSKYNVDRLVYYERLPGITQAIEREKQLKNWHRKWKLELITSFNPNMLDLSLDWYTERELKDFQDNSGDPESSLPAAGRPAWRQTGSG